MRKLGRFAMQFAENIQRKSTSDLARWAIVLLWAIGFCFGGAARAQFVQQGPKLVGRDIAPWSLEGGGHGSAISDDGNTAIVGGFHDNNFAGAAWVYTRTNGAWFQQGPKLVGTGAISPAGQGWSVSLSANGDIAVVGGQWDNSAPINPINPSQQGVGAVWIFTRSSGVWTQQALLRANDSVGTSSFGGGTAISSDGNTVAVGGGNDNGGVGAVWIFKRSGGVWTQQRSKLLASGAVGNAAFGGSMSLSSDGNTLLVGGPGDNGSVGAAWVFTYSNGAWTQQGSKLVGTGAVGGSQQGNSVALSADGNTAVIGGVADNNMAGAAWVFTRSGGVWTQLGSKLVGNDSVGAAWQGYGVSIDGGGNTIAVGGIKDNSNVGATWIFLRSGSAWSQQGSKLVGTGWDKGIFGQVYQGESVALSRYGNTLLVGGSNDASWNGASWVFQGPPGGVGVGITTGSGALWQQMALPCSPSASPASVANLFGSGSASNLTTANYNVPNPGASTGWAIFSRNPTVNTYNLLGVSDALSVGAGYWIQSYEAPTSGRLSVTCSTVVDAPVMQAQGCSSANGCFAIRVTTVSGGDRQNLVGNPFPWPVDWSQVRVRINGSSTTYTPSQAAGLAASGNASPPVLSNTFWVWNGTAYDTWSDTFPSNGNLQYFKSFWVKALSGASGQTVELLIPKDVSTIP